MEMGRWGGYKFTVSSSLIRGFTGLTVKGQAETEDKTNSGEKYVSYKNSKPHEISMTVMLHTALGVDAREEAMSFVADAAAGKTDFLYIVNKKLVPHKLMLTSAEVTDTKFGPKGQWISCKVKLTFKAATNNDGTIKKTPGKPKPTKPRPTTTIDALIQDPGSQSGLDGLSAQELAELQAAFEAAEQAHEKPPTEKPQAVTMGGGGLTGDGKLVQMEK